MENNAVITLVGCQTAEEETARTEFVTEGYYHFTGNGCLLTYEETEITGLEGTTTTIVTEGDEAVLTRSGNNQSHLVFKPGQRYAGHYDTPYGAFTVGVFANQVDFDLSEQGGRIVIDYLLEMNSFPVSSNKIELSILRVEEKKGRKGLQ